MPKKPAPAAAEQSAAPAVDPQKQYLMDQFGNLMEQVGDGFGGPLQEELVSRLEQTIADFHEEVNEMLTNLKENSEKRHERLKEIWDNPDGSADTGGGDETGDKLDGGSEEMSEWEKKIEAGGDNGGHAPKEEEPKKKKGFFGRKKK